MWKISVELGVCSRFIVRPGESSNSPELSFSIYKMGGTVMSSPGDRAVAKVDWNLSVLYRLDGTGGTYFWGEEKSVRWMLPS